MHEEDKKDPSESKFVYIIKEDPVPLARARISSNPTNRRVYDPQKQYKLVTQLDLKYQHGNRPLYRGPLSVEACFYFHIPITRKGCKPGDYKESKPDIDNLEKMLFDLGNDILWTDDAQVVKTSFIKVYDTVGRTEFTITELENNEKKEERRTKTNNRKRTSR